MGQILESAASGRAKCRGCGQPIARGELRFGERLPNPFSDGDSESTYWYHPLCAAYKRPDALLELTGQGGAADLPERAHLEAIARRGVEHPRLPRISGAERAPGGQAHCRHCRENIERGNWRIRIMFHDEGRFSPGGYIHFGCREAYFGTPEGIDAVLHFSPDLDEQDRAELTRLDAAGRAAPAATE